jgi:hypothetical protein
MKVFTVGRGSLYEFCVELPVAISSTLCLTFPSGIFSLDFNKIFFVQEKDQKTLLTLQHLTFNFRNPFGLHSVICVQKTRTII